MKHPRFILAEIAQKLEDARLSYRVDNVDYTLGDFMSDVHRVEELARSTAWALSDEVIGKAPTEQKDS